jgi:hypothetical protein
MPLIGFALATLPNDKKSFVVAGGVSNKIHLKSCFLFTLSLEN